jgi:hypothetical protein
MVVFFASLLHSLVEALLHERLVFKAHCSSGLDGGKSKTLSGLHLKQQSEGSYSSAKANPGEQWLDGI